MKTLKQQLQEHYYEFSEIEIAHIIKIVKEVLEQKRDELSPCTDSYERAAVSFIDGLLKELQQ